MCFISHKLNHCSASYPIEFRIARYRSAQPIYLWCIRQFVQFDILGKDRFGSEDEIYFIVQLISGELQQQIAYFLIRKCIFLGIRVDIRLQDYHINCFLACFAIIEVLEIRNHYRHSKKEHCQAHFLSKNFAVFSRKIVFDS